MMKMASRVAHLTSCSWRTLRQRVNGLKSVAGLATGVAGLALVAATPVAALEESPRVFSMDSKLVEKSLLIDIVAIAGKRLVAVGERGHVIYSDDQGKSWIQAKVPTQQLLTAVAFATDKQGWAVGHDGLILFTSDGGENWEIQHDGLSAKAQQNRTSHRMAKVMLNRKKRQLENAQKELLLLQNDATADDTAVAAAEEKIEEVQSELEDAELGLEDAELELQSTVADPLLDIWFENEKRGIAIGAFGKVLETKNGGRRWAPVVDRIDNPDEAHFNAIDQSDDGQTLIIAGEMGYLWRSKDAGDTWEMLESPYEGSYFDVIISPVDNTVLVFGISGALFRSTDLGDSWSAVEADVEFSLAGGAFRKDGGAIVVGVAGQVLKSRDGGFAFETTIRKNRLTLSNVAVTAEGNLVAVGMGGVQLLEPLKEATLLSAEEQASFN